MVKVELISWTKDPMETIAAVWDASRSDGPLTRRDGTSLFFELLKNKIPVLEMLDFIFVLDDISVALREQMVRHRVGVRFGDRVGVDIVPDLGSSTWWSQSMRVLDMGEFATDRKYVVPEEIEKDMVCRDAYREAMLQLQSLYNFFRGSGIPEEQARMILPLATTHRIVWKINLMALLHVLGSRCCWIAQLGDWGPVLAGMVRELREKVHPAFGNLAHPMCVAVESETGRPSKFCGCSYFKYNLERIYGEDPGPPCPLFLKYHRDDALQEDLEKNPIWEHDPVSDSWSCSVAERMHQYETQVEYFNDLWGGSLDAGDQTVV